MHLFYENVAPEMARLWHGTAETTNRDEDFVISGDVWRDIPAIFGRPSRSISRHQDGYRATEWRYWIQLYSLFALNGLQKDSYLISWCRFVRAAQLSV
jgi:hypothetical protein